MTPPVANAGQGCRRQPLPRGETADMRAHMLHASEADTQICADMDHDGLHANAHPLNGLPKGVMITLLEE
jgi:hypothetical protein